MHVAVSVLETGEPADDLERVLDAVGRLPVDGSEGVSRLAAPIAKRARAILARPESSPFTGSDPRADIAAVLLAWVTGELLEPSLTKASDPGAGAFLSARAREVAEATRERRPFRGVAAPTHTGGWIDPLVLVERLASRPPASRLDLVAAILRLAPGGRDTACKWLEWWRGHLGGGRVRSCAMRWAVKSRSVRQPPGGLLPPG